MSPWQPDFPYNDLPPLPPSTELETRAVLKQCITARAALAAPRPPSAITRLLTAAAGREQQHQHDCAVA